MKLLFSHLIKVVFIITFAMMMASCSFKTFYNQLDNIIPNYVEGVVSLDSLLEEKVSQRTLVLINWHRDTQLNQYANWLRVVQRDANYHLTEEMISKHIATLYRYWKSISLKIDEEMVLLLPQLNTEQRKELFSSIDEKNDEFHEEVVEQTSEERIKQYTDRIIDNLEIWLGDLTDAQHVLVKQAGTRLQSTASYRLELRKQWQQSIKLILDTNNSTSQKTTSLHEFFTSYKSQENAAMEALVNMNKNIISHLILQILHSMTDEQKAYFVTSTNNYIRMFEELAIER